jgi:hypothetical protein
MTLMNFSGLRRDTLIGRPLVLSLKLVPQSSVARLLQGRLRGARWIVGPGTHGCCLGTYELPKQREFDKAVREGHVVYDVGANVGFYSLLAACCVGENGKVHAFEPLPRT